MIENYNQDNRKKKRDRIKQRIQVTVDEENYEYYPAQKQVDFYDTEVHQKVAAYCRVSTDSDEQQFSFELQKKYYEDYVASHGNWELTRVYADEGKSGTGREKRKEFNEMIDACFDNQIDLVVTKSVSRFSRNVVDCISLVRELQELKRPVGVFFESECIFSLNEDSQMALSFIATMAEEESHIRSRSMESSLRMRLDNGIPLTPKLLGYSHDSEGNLVINPEEAPTVKLAFYMYLYGYSTQQIADAFIALERKSYLGNIKWTANSIVQILRNERHCGDVLTRKTYTPNYRNHLSKKNRGQRPQSRYFNHHEAIVSRDDFNAVQKMLDNAKYGNKSLLPELRVIDSGILKGFVSINPRWAGFKERDYFMAAQSVYVTGDDDSAVEETDPQPVEIHVEAGDFDLRGFEITRSEFFDASYHRPMVSFGDRTIKFNVECVRKFGAKNRVELLVNPISKKFAVRPTDEKNRNAVVFSKISNGIYYPREVAASAFFSTLFSIFGWNIEYKYRIIGSLLEKDGELAYVFDVANSEAFFKSYILPKQATVGDTTHEVQPFLPSGKRIRAIPEEWTTSFGRQFYLHELDKCFLHW
jgi:site-specific DNA recombinase